MLNPIIEKLEKIQKLNEADCTNVPNGKTN